MLSRRQLRIKVLQALYAFSQGEKTDIAIAERELFRSINKVYELYLYILLLIREIGEASAADSADNLRKFFPVKEELSPKNHLNELAFVRELGSSEKFKTDLTRTGISWQLNLELIRKLFQEIKKSPEYKIFLHGEKINEAEFLCNLVKKNILNSKDLQQHIEEENIFWQDDFDFICHMIIRTIKNYYDTKSLELTGLYKDAKDDQEFVSQLFSTTIVHDKEYEKSISERTKNWEVERIALMDILILKMALAELVTFQSIPVKVTINEYIDISKEYSTPKSKQFVNGVLDKLTADYKEQGKIVKTGRGLME